MLVCDGINEPDVLHARMVKKRIFEVVGVSPANLEIGNHDALGRNNSLQFDCYSRELFEQAS